MKVAEAFDKSLFWDVDPEKLDWERSAKFIVQRVLVRGGMKDVNKVFARYSSKQLVEIIKTCRDLDKVTHNFCCHYFDIPKKEMHAPSEYY